MINTQSLREIFPKSLEEVFSNKYIKGTAIVGVSLYAANYLYAAHQVTETIGNFDKISATQTESFNKATKNLNDLREEMKGYERQINVANKRDQALALKDITEREAAYDKVADEERIFDAPTALKLMRPKLAFVGDHYVRQEGYDSSLPTRIVREVPSLAEREKTDVFFIEANPADKARWEAAQTTVDAIMIEANRKADEAATAANLRPQNLWQAVVSLTPSFK